VYEAQKEMPLRPGQQKRLREVLSIEDSVTTVERDRVWEQYTKMMDLITATMVDRGLATLRGSRAEDLAAMRDAFVEKNKYWTDPETGRQVFSPWYRDFSAVDHTNVDKRIEEMWDCSGPESSEPGRHPWTYRLSASSRTDAESDEAARNEDIGQCSRSPASRAVGTDFV
jgi:hypothetical protein